MLVADDNADLRDYIRHLLGTRHEVLLATDGLDSLETARPTPTPPPGRTERPPQFLLASPAAPPPSPGLPFSHFTNCILQ